MVYLQVLRTTSVCKLLTLRVMNPHHLSFLPLPPTTLIIPLPLFLMWRHVWSLMMRPYLCGILMKRRPVSCIMEPRVLCIRLQVHLSPPIIKHIRSYFLVLLPQPSISISSFLLILAGMFPHLLNIALLLSKSFRRRAKSCFVKKLREQKGTSKASLT